MRSTPTSARHWPNGVRRAGCPPTRWPPTPHPDIRSASRPSASAAPRPDGVREPMIAPYGAADGPVRVYPAAAPPGAGLGWAHAGGFAPGDLDMPAETRQAAARERG